MTVVVVGREKLGIFSSEHLIFNYTQQRQLSEHKFVLSVLPHIRSLHDSEALTFLLPDKKNKNTSSQCVCVHACVRACAPVCVCVRARARTYSRVNQFKQFTKLNQAYLPFF